MRAAEVHEQIERERQGIGRDETAEHNRMVESGGPICKFLLLVISL
jgi:hypothetical protein